MRCEAVWCPEPAVSTAVIGQIPLSAQVGPCRVPSRVHVSCSVTGPGHGSRSSQCRTLETTVTSGCDHTNRSTRSRISST